MDRENIALEFISFYKRYKDKNLKPVKRSGSKKGKIKVTSKRGRTDWEIYP